MAVVRYTVANGEIIAEKRGGVRRSYVPDPLGSTVALLDSTQTKTDTFSYWPYGEVQSRTGTTATPFQFVGTLGYYRDATDRMYVRARYLRPNMGRWQTVDPLWPAEAAYKYVRNSPVIFADESGLQCGCSSSKMAECCSPLPNWMKAKMAPCTKCFKSAGAGFLLDMFPTYNCWEVEKGTNAQANPNTSPCSVELPAWWGHMDERRRCQTLLHELLHCYCNIFKYQYSDDSEFEDVHDIMDDWAWELINGCWYGPGGSPRQVRPGPPDQMPQNICDLIRGKRLPPSKRKYQRGTHRR